MRWKHGLPETACGSGSMLKNTVSVRKILPQWIRKYSIRTLVDAGAGDMNWISKVGLPCEYLPFDKAPRHETVRRADITVDRLPDCDAILCRHVLNHLGETEAVTALRLLRQSAKHLILTTGSGPWRAGVNGHFSEYDLRMPPFDLGEPLEFVEDCRGQLAIWR